MMLRTVLFNLCYLMLNVFVGYEAARILAVFPAPAPSHQFVFRSLTHELARRGHEVVVVTPNPAFPKGEAPANLTEVDVHDVSYSLWTEFFSSVTGKNTDLSDSFLVSIRLLTQIFEKQLQTDEVQSLIRNENKEFDLLLIEALVRPTLGLSHIFKVPVIQVSSFGVIPGNYETVGAPIHPFLYPASLRQKLNNLTLWDKFTELYKLYMIEKQYYAHEETENEMLRRTFGRDIPSLNELSNNVDMLFMNVNPIWEGNHPVPPNVIHMGGLPEMPRKELPKDLKDYLDSSEKGVIYMSLGTNYDPSTLPQEKLHILIKVLSQVPYDILLKWHEAVLPGTPKNIRVGKWFPQSDLLRHPKIKLFITQGGLHSTDDAISAGVPMIGFPLLGDQWYNVEKYITHKIGLRLDLESLTEENLKNAIDTIIGDESYRRNLVRLGSLMRDQPQKPLERAIWWIEHVLRHGGARHLRAPAANITWREHLELDLILAVLSVILALIIMFLFIAYSLYRLIKKKIVITSKLKAT